MSNPSITELEHLKQLIENVIFECECYTEGDYANYYGREVYDAGYYDGKQDLAEALLVILAPYNKM